MGVEPFAQFYKECALVNTIHNVWVLSIGVNFYDFIFLPKILSLLFEVEA